MDALQIINKAMCQMAVQCPPLYSAVKLLKPTEYPEAWRGKSLKAVQNQRISTDGIHLWYTPEHVEYLERFKTKYNSLTIQDEIMHVIMHCILGHLEDSLGYKDKKVIWAAMDRLVWHLSRFLKLPFMKEYSIVYNYEVQDRINEYLGERYDLSCYYIAKEDLGIRKKLLKDAKGFVLDDHSLWNPKEIVEKRHGSGKGVSSENQKKPGEGMFSELQEKPGDGIASEEQLRAAREAWKALREVLFGDESAEETLVEIMKENFGGESNTSYGSESGDGAIRVTAVEGNQNSYANVLRRFLKMKEVQRDVPDTIDVMLYQYGLELYGDVPLIEPPESEEELNLSTICVAIDTSGSCTEEAGKFFRETKNILSDLSRLAPKCEFYFFQCDTEIDSEEHYTDVGDIPWKEMEEIAMYGWGGTSFVPVFDRIHELQEEEEKTIDCLIYFSDAMGDFPREEPGYPVFFVLPQELTEDELAYVQIPDWIEVISLGKEGDGWRY